MAVVRGRLLEASAAPQSGEHVEQLLSVRNLVVEEILSGAVDPVDYLQDQDEWVVVLDGSATLEAAEESYELGSGDWLFLPAGTPHRVTSTAPGTRWLAVHLHPGEVTDS